MRSFGRNRLRHTECAYYFGPLIRRNAKSDPGVESEAGEYGAGRPLDPLGGCSKGFAAGVDEAEDGQSGVGQGSERLGQPGPLGVVTIFVPPAVLDEMKAVFHLPVVANVALELFRRDRTGIQAGHEVPAVTG
jgi:hypothetical protein